MTDRLLLHDAQVSWHPLAGDDVRGLEAAVLERLARTLEGWRKTRYATGQRAKGVAASCLGFIAGVLGELDPSREMPSEAIPPDAALHDPRTAIREMRRLLREFRPSRVRDGRLQPGDAIVTGARGGGPGHIRIVGTRPNTIWHMGTKAVQQTGWMIEGRLFRMYRMPDRWRWAGAPASVTGGPHGS